MGTILVTGGAGFIGSNVVKLLVGEGHDVVVFDSFINYVYPEGNYYKYLDFRLNSIRSLSKVSVVRGDVRNKMQFKKALNDFRPDKVLHLAALPISTLSNKYSEDAMEINLNGTINVLESIKMVDFVKRFVFASSSMVYGDFQYAPADEQHPTNPIDVYGGTKLAGEILTKVYSRQYGIEYTIIRPSAVYGPTDSNNRVSQLFVEAALKGKPLVLHGGGSSKLDFTYVEDTAQGFALAVDSDKAANETFNITAGHGRSIREFADIVGSLVEGVSIVNKNPENDEKRPERGTLDISKAKRVLGYDPKFDLEEGIKKYVEFVKASL